MQPSLDVVIVNWKAAGVLRDCLASLFASARSGFSFGRVTVVDNASGDGCSGVVGQVPGVELISNSVNRGFAAACNAGAATGCADYVLFLNPDVVLSPGALETVVRFFEKPEARMVGINGIRLLTPVGRPALSCSRFPTLRSMILETSGLSLLERSFFRSRHMRPEELQSSRQVDQVIGAFFAVRRTMFEALGGFDERFFVYFEEVDFALRARNAGWSSHFLAEAEATHAGRVSSDQSKTLRLLYFVRSRLLYSKKHFNPAAFAIVLLFSILIEPVARIGSALAGKSQSTVGEVVDSYGRLCAAGACCLWRGMQQRVQRRVFTNGEA